jgi:hypothetical protein
MMQTDIENHSEQVNSLQNMVVVVDDASTDTGNKNTNVCIRKMVR